LKFREGQALLPVLARRRRDRKRDEQFNSPERFGNGYIQHSAHIPPGREGLIGLVKSAGPDFRYENHVIVANGDWVLMHGRFSGLPSPANWIVVDVIRIENGKLAEHWDVIQEKKKEASVSGLPMFGDAFPAS
jgi:predicted SnoaL-like aldol condensation-catalyzing enzyme